MLGILCGLASGQQQWSFPSHATAKPEEGPLLHLVEVVFADGAGGPLTGRLCTALGVTKDNRSFPVEQETARGKDYNRSLNVSRHRGMTDIIMTKRAGGDTTLFLTTVKGDLVKAIAERGSKIEDLDPAAAAADFEAEKAWWMNTWLKDYDAKHR